MDRHAIALRRSVPWEAPVIISGGNHARDMTEADLGINRPIQIERHKRSAVATESLVRGAAFQHDRVLEITEIPSGRGESKQEPTKRVEFVEAAIRRGKPRHVILKKLRPLATIFQNWIFLLEHRRQFARGGSSI